MPGKKKNSQPNIAHADRGRIVVLGMHRSGTSCVGNLLTKLGVYFGDAAVATGSGPENPKGFFERRDMRDVCDTILHGSGCDWWAVNDFSPGRVPSAVRAEANVKFVRVLEDLEAHRPWFIKEPRLCLTFPLLAPWVADPVFVLVWRRPIEVAQSLAVRNGFPIDFSLALWEAYVRAALAVCRGKPTVLVHYNDLVAEPYAQTERLVQVLRDLRVHGISLPARDVVVEAADVQLHRNRSEPHHLADLLSPSQQRLFDALAGGETGHPAFDEPLSTAAQVRIADWARREGVLLALRRAAGANSRATLQATRLQVEIDNRNQKIAELNEQLKNNRAKDEQNQRNAQAETARLIEHARIEWDAERRKLAASLERRDDEVAQVRAELAQALRERQQAVNLIEALEVSRKQWDAERRQLTAALDRRDAEAMETKSALAKALEEHRKILETVNELRESQRQWANERARLTEDLARNARALTHAEAQLVRERAAHQEATARIEKTELKLTEQAGTLARRDGRIAALRHDLRLTDGYVEKLKLYLQALEPRIEGEAAQRIERAEMEREIEAARTAALEAGNGATLRALFRGAAAGKSARRSVDARRLAIMAHYAARGRRDAADLVTIATSGLFDIDYYLKQNPDVAKAKVDPLLHYVDFGAAEGRNPSALFDTRFYLRCNPDVTESGVNPLFHFVTHGRGEGRLPRPLTARRISPEAWQLPPPPTRQVSRQSLAPARRAVVFTAVTGGYDDLQPPGIALPSCEFVVFSDQPLQVEGWQVRPLNYLHPDPTRAARFVKLHPHVYFPDYDHSIWIDANIGIQGDIRIFLDRLTPDAPVGMFVHPARQCVYVEGAECIKRQKDAPDTIERQLNRYRAEGFPEYAGLWETGVLVSRHNEPSCIALMTAWWREIETGSRRDQLSLPVVARRLKVPIAALDNRPGANARDHDLVALVPHPKERHVAAEATLPAAPRKPVDAERIAVDVGVCVHNSLEETRACLNALLAARRPHDRIVVIDDASAAPAAAFLDQFARDHDRIVLRRHERNRGYTASANAFFREGQADWMLLLNSDTVVPPRALTKLVRCGEQFDALGAVGPLSNAASWQTVPRLTGPDGKFLVNALPDGLGVEDMDRLCEELAPGAVLFAPLLNGFCLTIRRAMLEKIGPFDEASFPMGYGEEDDFCLRAGAAGYLCGIAPDTYVFHVKSASFTPEGRKPLAEAGAKALRLKHSVERIGAAIEMLKGHSELKRIREGLDSRCRPQPSHSSSVHSANCETRSFDQIDMHAELYWGQ